MFGDPLAAFAIALFFLRSALDATAAGGSGGGTDCACEACAGAAAVELVWLTGGISLITLLMSSVYSCSSLLPSQRSAHAWPSKPKTSSVTTPCFALVFNSWNWSVVNAPLCLSLPNSALTRSKAAAFMSTTALAAWLLPHALPAAPAREQRRAGVLPQTVGFFLWDCQKSNRPCSRMILFFENIRQQAAIHSYLRTDNTPANSQCSTEN